MLKVVRYQCEYCTELFHTREECSKHEARECAAEKARKMLSAGNTLKEIQDECHLWEALPEHLYDVTKDNCFKISYWQCCEKPAYRITSIDQSGRVRVYGCGSWMGYYGNWLSIDDVDLTNPRPKEELYIAKTIY